MIHAYSECYLDRARKTMGTLFDAGLLLMDGEEFLKVFAASPVAAAWEQGDPAYLAGRSGDELFTLLTGDLVDPDIHDFDPTPEFWMGSAYCYLQWFFDRPFAEIFAALPLAELRRLRKERRDAAFEAAAAKCVRVFQPQSTLKRLRTARQLSQSQLALVSGVKLRSIRAYEQGDLDVAKAQYDTLRALSGALSCTVEDLIR
ncbi:MAG: helix-turn-helix transcriptional regulator [Oscillospiraceae bacterium]|nr:helix-turn-helix transcriptional regulator [Oscillospiraceae bacterium]